MCEETNKRPFDPKPYLIKVQGGRQYLPVSARLIWFRQDHPDWGIETESLFIDPDKQAACFRAKIYDADGKLISTGTKYEDVRGFPDWIEKAETGSVGRALAMCGYGTQFAPEIEEGARFADTPRQQQQRGQAPRQQAQQGRPQTSPQSQQPTRQDQTPFGAAVRDKANVQASGDDDATGLFDSVKAFEAAMPVQARNRAKSDWVKTKNAPPNLDTMDETDLRSYLAHLKQFTDGVGQ
ncbi:MAG TPA: hypothetical protein VN519_06510 [Bryobacteraceae bacterium]|nr:hypothetical protein [Bryobacteraceae bacterium]